jgi:hypothetical protein
VGNPSWPFVWNKALSAPLRAAGLDGADSMCPALLQVCAGCWVLFGCQLCPCSYMPACAQQNMPPPETLLPAPCNPIRAWLSRASWRTLMAAALATV